MRVRHLLVAVGIPAIAIAMLGERASAIPLYQAASSTATFIHDPDLGVAGVPALSATLVGTGTLTPRSNNKTFSPTTTMPTPASYQFATTDTRPAGAGNSVAKASVAHVTNGTTAAVKIASGTGVTQTSNVANAYSGASEMRINVDLLWTISASNTFGPPASGLASYAVGGKVGAGAGSYAQFESVLEFLDPLHPGTSYRAPITLSDTWMRGDADVAADGTFSKLFSDSALINLPTSSLPAGSQLELKGYILFRARSLPAKTIASAFTGDLNIADSQSNTNENGKDKDKSKDKDKNEDDKKNKDKDKHKQKSAGDKEDGDDDENCHRNDSYCYREDCDHHDDCEETADHPGNGIGHDPNHFKGQGHRYGWHHGHTHSESGCPPTGGTDLETFIGFPQEQILGGAQVFDTAAVPEPMTVALGSIGAAALLITLARRSRA